MFCHKLTKQPNCLQVRIWTLLCQCLVPQLFFFFQHLDMRTAQINPHLLAAFNLEHAWPSPGAAGRRFNGCVRYCRLYRDSCAWNTYLVSKYFYLAQTVMLSCRNSAPGFMCLLVRHNVSLTLAYILPTPFGHPVATWPTRVKTINPRLKTSCELLTFRRN